MRIARRVGAAAASAALVATAACSSGTTKGTSHANGDIAPTPTAKAYVEAVKAQEQATVAYAQQLVDHAPQMKGEEPLTTAPPNNLQQPDETIGASELVTRTRFWTVPGAADHAYRALTNIAVDGLVLSGHGLPSSPAEDQPGRGFLNYELVDQPPYIEGGELYLEMESAGNGHTVIAAYSEVYAHPVRYVDERMSLPGSTATATWPRIVQDKVVAHPSGSLTPDQVADVVNGFNRSPVANGPNVCFGGLGLGGSELDVTVLSAGHTWKLTYPGTSCLDLAVTRDSVEYPALQPDPAFRHLLRVLSHGDGTVAGHLLLVGGPAGAPPTPIEGKLALRKDDHPMSAVRTRGHGYFVLDAQPGSYTLTGSSTQYEINGHPGRCMATHTVVVQTDHTSHANVYCERR